MIRLRKAATRGCTQTDWLTSWHSFSFGPYQDPEFQGFGPLLVCNEDRIAPEKGFATHGHRDMEIVTYVISGTLLHRDSAGHQARIQAGGVQRMRAGTGIEHSEFNGSTTQPLHMMQLWFVPQEEGLPPGHEDIQTTPQDRQDGWVHLISPPEGGGALHLAQDASLYVTQLGGNAQAQDLFPLREDRCYWLQLLEGEVEINQLPMTAGDAAILMQEEDIRLHTPTHAHLMLIAVPR